MTKKQAEIKRLQRSYEILCFQRDAVESQLEQLETEIYRLKTPPSKRKLSADQKRILAQIAKTLAAASPFINTLEGGKFPANLGTSTRSVKI
jgi:branched-subunit amino acid aminotransferase/4-amino-4-deoxychorismate lyase